MVFRRGDFLDYAVSFGDSLVLVEGVVGDEGLEKGFVDFVAASYSAVDKDTDAELVDTPRTALREVKDSFDGLVGKQVVLASGSF